MSVLIAKKQTEEEIMKFIKPVMAVMLLACMLHLPYGYYSLVRFVAMVVFAVLAYQYYKENDTLMVTFGAFVLLFQPFIKIALGRGLWNLIDVVAAAILIALWAKELRK